MQAQRNITQYITLSAGIVITLIIIIFPLGYFFISYQYMVGHLETEAEINARLVTQIISANPEMWEFQHLRIVEYLSRRPGTGEAEIRRILNAKNELVIESTDELKTPLIMHSDDLMDSGVVVGRLEIYCSLRPLLIRTGRVALLMLPIGFGIFLILRNLPIRAIYRAEETLRRNEEETRRLAQEDAIMAEIGRIISSSLNIDEVYERFTKEVAKLLSFDRIVISIINHQDFTGTTAYTMGLHIGDRKIGLPVPLNKTATGEVVHTQSSLLINEENLEEFEHRFPNSLSTLQAGFRSMIFVPMFSKDQVITVFNLRSIKPNLYTEKDLELAKRVGNQIAGAIANAQLFREHQRAEEALQKSEEESKRIAQENAIMAEIGRIISSTLNIEEVYERFAEEVKKLVSFDRIVINMIDTEKGVVKNVYTAGEEVRDRNVEEIYPLEGSGNAEMVRTKSTLLVQTEDFNEYQDRFPMLLSTFQAGFRSIMNIPLFSKGKVIGGLLLRSRKPYAYTDEDVRQAERIGFQIAGAIANAQLFTERVRAEEALRKSEEEARRSSQENSVMAEIGRIISSTITIDEVYERFAEKISEFIPFDRISINIVNTKDNTCTIRSVAGVKTEGRQIGEVIPLAGSMTEETIRTRSSLLIDVEDREKLLQRFPILLQTIQSGIRSMMLTPLISKNEGIGCLYFRTTKPNAYTEMHRRFAERVANQIAGTIANAQLFSERVQAEQKAKSLEEQLRQSQKIEAVGRLAGGIAHDFNNLLTVIKGYSELLLIKLKEGDPLKGNIEEIHRASLRAADLTRQLLAFSRRQILEFKILNLNTILRDIDKMLRRILGEDIELVTLLTEDLGKVRTDPGQADQMIVNLAVNARDAMPSGGKLTIEIANVELDETYVHTHFGMKPGRYIMLSVSDTGSGMSPEVKEHLFEPFFTTKEKGKGTGLGLSTVYGIVKQSEGDISVYSEPGQGTTFKIYLPRVDEEASALPRGDDKRPLPRGSETILLVEDERSVRGLAVQILRENGYNLLEAANGIEALRMVQEYAGEIHLLLTDVVMPQMGGKELADWVKTFLPDVKVLFTSGYTDNAIVHHGVLEPGIDFLQKPFSPEALSQKVREVLDK